MARRSAANVKLAVGDWVTSLKLYRIQTEAEAPKSIITHTCRTEVSVIERCASCKGTSRVTGQQQTGEAKGKAATEPKDVICPSCQKKLEVEQTLFCGTCNRHVEADENEDRLAFDGQTVPINKQEYADWKALVPDGKEMRPIEILLSSLVASYLHDEAYQLVPEKGSALSFAAWREYLTGKKLALIVHFSINKHFKIGAIYGVRVRGTPTLILHTLFSYDQIDLEPFDLPDVPEEVSEQIHELTAPLRVGAGRQLEIEHPQRAAFHALFNAKNAGGQAQLTKLGALPGELAALSQQLGSRLSESKKTRKKQ